MTAVTEYQGSVALSGVGGMGVLKASEVLAWALVEEGLDVRQSEVHGMAQRGGTVVTHVRYGTAVHSPLIRAGEAHLLIGFEEAEALRYSGILAENGTAVVNLRRWPPPAVSRGEAAYPQGISQSLAKAGCAVHGLDADGIAQDAGDRRAFGSVLLGAASLFLPVSWASWQRAFARVFPETLRAVNLAAFSAGIEAVEARGAHP